MRQNSLLNPNFIHNRALAKAISAMNLLLIMHWERRKFMGIQIVHIRGTNSCQSSLQSHLSKDHERAVSRNPGPFLRGLSRMINPYRKGRGERGGANETPRFRGFLLIKSKRIFLRGKIYGRGDGF
ncbi:hypothetical protein CDAR_223271 [Caerostris darwini]|uniref:Uncharacterized protein n=1 Tax=Caerostris darwini TaxID=1538125 RepID=A0AAV4W6B1_9ARAC|nr:hypothetical protein CDAR_223271 [Caerostris darwini]